VECSACKGTGLYVGMAERDGAAVVCRVCKGTGCGIVKLQFNKFKGIKKRDDVVRVFDNSCGFIISAKNVVVDNKQINFEDAGVTYDEWQAGKTPLPIKDLHCPFLHTCQMLDREGKLYTSRCREGLRGFGEITKCKYYPNKNECWKIHEEECEKL